MGVGMTPLTGHDPVARVVACANLLDYEKLVVVIELVCYRIALGSERSEGIQESIG